MQTAGVVSGCQWAKETPSLPRSLPWETAHCTPCAAGEVTLGKDADSCHVLSLAPARYLPEGLVLHLTEEGQ